MAQAFICDAVRTPIGRYGGALASVRADDLGAIPMAALMRRNPSVDWSALDDVFYGNVNQAGEDNRNVARMSALLAGLPTSAGAVTINRLCASGLDAVGSAARAVRLGEAHLTIAGGVESMTRSPMVMPKAASAFSRHAEIYDTTIGWRFPNPRMGALYGFDSMPQTGENVARDFGVDREAQDRFALRSQERYAAAHAANRFARDLEPVTTTNGKTQTIVENDEHPRATTYESLAKLRPLEPGWSVTAGNASGINDGACALIVASEEAAAKHGLTPRARIVGMAAAGVEPRVMGLGPIPSTRKVLALVGWSVADVEVWEMNEAFAAQVIACGRELGIPEDSERLNMWGGAIAVGHPLGMSGARLVTNAVNQLHALGLDRAVCTMCIGVGQGVAVAIERV
jgi:acetyl-CoA C-acetyltransferase